MSEETMNNETVNNEETIDNEIENVQEGVEENAEKDTENVDTENVDTENVDTENVDAENVDAEEKKKGFFGKDKKDKKDEQIAEITDKHQRLMAEFQNFRNRTEKEKAAMFEMGAKSIVEKLLPIVDNFERGLSMMSEEDLESSVGQGMTMIYKQFTTTLEELGVEVIEAQGCEFDPELHNAVMHIESEEYGENMVAVELQKGYKYHGSVVRHSMVQVAN